MALAVLINGVDRSGPGWPHVKANSISISETLQQRSTAQLVYQMADGETAPPAGQEVKIYEGGVLRFGGHIVSAAAQELPWADFKEILIQCGDYSVTLDRRGAGERTYLNQYAGDIIRDLVAECLAGDNIDRTTVLAGSGPLLEKVELQYCTVREAFDEIARLSAGWAWRLEYDKKLYFWQPSALSVIATIGDASADALKKSVTVTEDLTNYANRVIVRLGNYITEEQTESFDGSHATQPTNGSRQKWEMAFRVYSQPRIYVNDIEKLVGIANVDTGRDWYWNKNSTVVEQDDDATPPASTATLRVVYSGLDARIFSAQNNTEISARQAIEGGSGVYERVLNIDSDTRNTDAQAMADSYLDRFDSPSYVLRLDTLTLYPEPGQQVEMDMTGHPTGNYVIKSVQTYCYGKNQFGRKVEAYQGPILQSGFEFFTDLRSGGSASGVVGSLPVTAESVERRSNTNNIAYDPSFENGADQWHSGTSGDVKWVEATDQFHSPTKSMSYTGEPGMSGKWAALSGFYNGYVESTVGKLYTISCWVRANSAAVGTLSLSIQCLSQVGAWRSTLANVDQDVAALADDTWIKLTASAYLDDTLVKYIYPQISIAGGTAGKIWVDDVEMREHEPSVPAPVGSATASFQVIGATDNSVLSPEGQECYRLRVYSISLPSDRNLVTFRLGYDRSDDSNTDFSDYSGPQDLSASEHKSDPWPKSAASFTIQAQIVGVNRDNVEAVLWTSSPVTVSPSGQKNIPGAKIADSTIPWSAAATAAGMTNQVTAVPNYLGYLAIAKTSEVVFNAYNGRLYVWSASLAAYKPKVDKGDFNNQCIDSYLIFANGVITNSLLAGSITTDKLTAGLLSGFTLYLEQNGVVSQFYSVYDAGMGAYTGLKTHRVSDGQACKISYGGIWVVAQSYPSTPLLWLGYPSSAYPTLGWQLPSWGSLFGFGNPIGSMYLNAFAYGAYVIGISTCKSQQFVDSTGKRLLGGRVTGWALPTGTEVRSTWNTATVTLEQLASSVNALIRDLYGSDTESTYPVKPVCVLGA